MLAPRIRLLGLIFGLFLMAACDTAEERAEGHYQRGLQLLEAGETQKALLEFRNALQLNEDALEPRLEFARIRLAEGNVQGAIGNFLKVIELDENHLEARTTTGRLLLQFDDDPLSAREHITVAQEIAPDDIEVRALVAGLAQKEERFEEAATLATALLEDAPGNIMGVSVLVAQNVAAEDYTSVVTLIDDALLTNPQELSLHVAKLQALEALEDQDAIGTQLEEMARLFPDNSQVAQGRVQWFLNTGDAAGAIAAQRDLAGIFADEPSHALQVAALLNQFEGADAARAELVTLAQGEAHKVTFTRALADFEFQQGEPDAAIALLEALIATDINEDETHDAQGQLANILRSGGDTDRALEIAQKVLGENPDHVESLKLRALSALDDDRPQNAISDLRTALGVQEQDPAILMMLALAHERNGSAGLAQERMALAVQASGSGVLESLRYAEFLTRQGKADIALATLRDAYDKHGDVPAILAGIGQVQLALSDWTGATDTVARLAALSKDPQNQRIAQELQLAILNGEKRFDQSIGVLRDMWDAAGETTSAMENLVRNYVLSGKTEDAAEFLDGVLKDDVANLRANLLRGALHAFEGQTDQAEFRYRKVIEDHPNAENGYGALASLLAFQGRRDEADAVIAAGIENAQNTSRLLFSRASRLEEERDYEGAIAIYEQLYAANKVSDILANNLASLLSEFRDDPESLERAFNISKRLRNSQEPAFQDTYGWILYKRGEYEQAVRPLIAAAQGAPNNVFVQYHLGMVYEKLGKDDLAITQLTRALELGEGTDLPVLETARETLDSLQGG